MGHRVIGITRSGSRVKAAVVETRLRRFELKAVFELDLACAAGAESTGDDEPREMPVEGLGVAINRALTPQIGPGDSVVVQFPGDEGFIRRLGFPFRDRAKIAEVLPVELGGTLPTGLDLSLHTIFERAGDEGNDIVAVGVNADTFSRFIESTRADGIDPDHVGIESVELASLIPYVESTLASESGAGRRNVMILYAEDRLVEFMVCRGTNVVFCRAVRLDTPVMVRGETGMAFMREVLLSTAAASEAGAPLDVLYTCGDDAEAIASVLGEALSMDCRVLDPAALGIPGADACQGVGPSMARAIALAVGAASGGGPGSMNLRTGQFGSEGTAGLLRERAGFFAVSLLVFAVLGIGWTAVRYAGLIQDRKAIEQQLTEYSSALLESEVESFESALATVRAGAREEFGLFPAWTAVGSLEKLTRALVAAGPAGSSKPAATEEEAETEETPPGDPGFSMEFESVRIEPKQATFKGEAESIEKVDELINRLRGDQCFHDIVTESTERIQFQRHQGWQRFSVRLNIDCAGKDPKKAGRDAAPAKDTATAEEE